MFYIYWYLIQINIWKRLLIVTLTIFKDYLVVTLTVFKKYLMVTIDFPEVGFRIPRRSERSEQAEYVRSGKIS